MAQYIKNANIFGRIGSNIGKGLAEQIPEEVKRNRLNAGLQDLEKDSGGLNQQQYFTRALQVPHLIEHPQAIQSLAELAKQQQIKNAYKRKGSSDAQSPYESKNLPSSANLENVKFGQRPGQIERNIPTEQTVQKQTIPSNLSREQEAKSNPPAASENPLDNKFVPPSPWGQEMDEQAINEAFDRGIATTFNEARDYANRRKEMYENAPEAYRKQLAYKQSIDQKTDDLYDKQVQERLQKEGKQTYQDLPGDLQLDIKKVARNAVATGKMTPDQAAEYYSKKSLDLAKDKGRLNEIANRSLEDRLLPHKKEESIKNLQHLAKNFADLGADEYFYNLLKSDKVDESGTQEGMGLSPGGAAIINYERTPKVKSLIQKTKISPKNSTENTREFANNLFNVMTPKDSFLAIARQMKQQDPNFDEYAFFDFLRENKDRYGSNKRLDREVSQGVSDFFPNWRDIGLFPAFSKSVAND